MVEDLATFYSSRLWNCSIRKFGKIPATSFPRPQEIEEDEKITTLYPSHTNVCNFFKFSAYIFSADIAPEMLKLCRVTKVKVFFLVLVNVFNFNLFEFLAAILDKGLLNKQFGEAYS